MGPIKEKVIQLCKKLQTIDLTGPRSLGHAKEVQLGHLPRTTGKLPAVALCKKEERSNNLIMPRHRKKA